MVTASDVTSVHDAKCGERVFLCHDHERGYKANIRLHQPTKVAAQDRAWAITIAQGHFDAKARAEGKALV